MKKEFKGFGKIFSFTFLHHVKSKGYIASTLVIAMLCLLIPAGVMAGRELTEGSGRQPEPMAAETEEQVSSQAEQQSVPQAENTADTEDLKRELSRLKFLYVADRSEDGLDELPGFCGYLREETGLDLQLKDFGKDFDGAAEALSGRGDALLLVADQVGKDFELNLLVPAGGPSEEAAETIVPVLDGYAEIMKERINAGFAGETSGEAESTQSWDGETSGTAYGEDDELAELKEIVAMLLTFLNIMVLYFFLLIYGQGVAGSVIMEKSSKLMEVFLTSVKPSAMIMGKLLAISLSGMLQLASWVVSLFAGFALGGVLAKTINPDAGDLLREFFDLVSALTNGMFSAGTLIAALLMALLGVLLYCSLAAIGGSLASKQEDLSSTNVVFTLILIVSFFAVLYGGGIEGFGADTGWFKTLLDWIPFTAVMITPSKILLGLIPMGKGIASMVLTGAVTLILIGAAGRIYKAMALYRGQVLSLKSVFRMIKPVGCNGGKYRI